MEQRCLKGGGKGVSEYGFGVAYRAVAHGVAAYVELSGRGVVGTLPRRCEVDARHHCGLVGGGVVDAGGERFKCLG